MIDYAEELRAALDHAAPRLRAMSPDDAARRPANGGWSPKEILGHLVDSASNNHQRFVRAQFTTDLVAPGYEQDGWVRVQSYQSADWASLIFLWEHFNRHLAHLMDAMDAHVRMQPRHPHNLHEIASNGVPPEQPVTLDYFMRDYVFHLRHHLRQMGVDAD